MCQINYSGQDRVSLQVLCLVTTFLEGTENLQVKTMQTHVHAHVHTRTYIPIIYYVHTCMNVYMHAQL